LNEYEKYITASFRINMYTFSGLKVDSLNVSENYTTYKVLQKKKKKKLNIF